jgi:hypothetical protein
MAPQQHIPKVGIVFAHELGNHGLPGAQAANILGVRSLADWQRLPEC